jgi:hypothetical protein
VVAPRLRYDSGLDLRAARSHPIDNLAADAENRYMNLRIESSNEVGKAEIGATGVAVVGVHH